MILQWWTRCIKFSFLRHSSCLVLFPAVFWPINKDLQLPEGTVVSHNMISSLLTKNRRIFRVKTQFSVAYMTIHCLLKSLDKKVNSCILTGQNPQRICQISPFPFSWANAGTKDLYSLGTLIIWRIFILGQSTIDFHIKKAPGQSNRQSMRSTEHAFKENPIIA